MKKLTSFLFSVSLLLGLTSLPALSQKTISGQVKDAATGAALPYVNIGVKGENTGTVSDGSGNFVLTVPELLLIKDSLTFSSLEHRERSLFIPDLSEEAVVVALQPAPVPLAKGEIQTRKWKEKTIGAKSAPSVLHGIATSRQGDILEIAQPVKVRRKPLQLLTARLYLNSTNDDSCTFRIKIYADKDGRPGNLLMAENTLIRQKAEKGWITAELEEFGFIMKEDFFISFEFVPESQEEATRLVYGGKIGKGRGYSRSSSLGEWEAAPCSYAIQAQVAIQR